MKKDSAITHGNDLTPRGKSLIGSEFKDWSDPNIKLFQSVEDLEKFE